MAYKSILVALCVLGAVLPISQFIPWMMTHGLDISLFIHLLFVNSISGFFAWDVLVSAVVLVVFIVVEARRLAMKNYGLAIVATLSVGVSLGLPLFLYLRELQLEKQAR